VKRFGKKQEAKMDIRGFRKLWVLIAIGILGIFSAAVIVAGCGGDDDDDNDDSSDDDVDDDTTADDTTTEDDTVTDDDVDDDIDDDDDDTVASDAISGYALDFKTRTALSGATVEAVNDADGTSFDPAIVATAGTDGYVLLPGIPASKGSVGVKVTYNGYKDTYEYHFETGTTGHNFYGVSNALVTIIATLLGVTFDTSKGFASGAVYYNTAGGDDEPLGCAHVTFSPEVSEVHYFMQSEALGVIPTTDRDWSGDADHNGEGTNPSPDGDGNPMSFFIGLNADVGAYTVSADADGSIEESTIPMVFANSVAITTVRFMAADYASNPTPSWCTE